MTEQDIDKSKIMVDGRYKFTMSNGTVHHRRGTFLLACSSTKGWFINKERLSRIVKIEED